MATSVMRGQRLHDAGVVSIVNAYNARSEEASALEALFSSRWLWAAITLSLRLHCAVLYMPFMQEAFSTMGLSSGDFSPSALSCG
jgi:magnesium-transporting ATPase (P-type)